jgi:hypothetical protein
MPPGSKVVCRERTRGVATSCSISAEVIACDARNSALVVDGTGSMETLEGGPLPDVGTMRDRNERRCRRILDSAAPLRVDDLAWADVADTPLPPDVLGCLVYMRDVEGFTDRDLVGMSAHPTTLADPLVRAFLDIWRLEERGHTEALERFLGAYDPSGDATPARPAPPPAVATRLENTVARLGDGVGGVVCAMHMAWGAANELLAMNGYRILARRCGHPVLSPLLLRIAAQEARHHSFYFLQAQWRLARSRVARFTLRRLLAGAWTPVGIGDGYKSEDEFRAVARFLAEGDDGRRVIEQMDRRFSSLPGCDDIRIFAGSLGAGT